MLSPADITLRREKGSALSRDELDDNFDGLRVFANEVEALALVAQSTADGAALDASENRTLLDAIAEALETDEQAPVVTVNYNGARIYRQATEPVPPPGGFKVSDLWVHEGQPLSSRFKYWSGSAWVVDSIAIDTVDLAVGILPIEVVDALPEPGNAPRFVFLTTDGKQYSDKGDHWEHRIPATDIEGELPPINFGNRTITGDKVALNTLDGGHINVGSLDASHLKADEVIITSSLQVGDSTVPDEAIVGIAAEKINVGKLKAVDIAHSGGLYESGHPDAVFRTITWLGSWQSDHNFGAGGGFTFNHCTPCILRGVAHPDGIVPGIHYGPNHMAVRNGEISLMVNAEIHDYSGHLVVYYEKNGSGVFTPMYGFPIEGNPHAVTGFFFRRLSGFTNEDEIKIYVAPCDVAGNLNSDGITTRYVITVLSLNW